MKTICTVCFYMLLQSTMAQKVINLTFLSDTGITTNIKVANKFIVVKKYENSYQQLYYKQHGPLITEKNYSDSSLQILHGKYYEYDYGKLYKTGEYKNNLKESAWYTYNDTGKVIFEEYYEKDILIKTVNTDTVKISNEKDTFKRVEVEASFGKNKKDWLLFLQKNLNGNVAQDAGMGGSVVVTFTIDTTGNCIDIHMAKSREYNLDEEARRVIEKSPLWNPAIQDGKLLKAYRKQPLTFVLN
jgi:periplasmic protein TonB